MKDEAGWALVALTTLLVFIFVVPICAIIDAIRRD